jgi:hypothetical protein
MLGDEARTILVLVLEVQARLKRVDKYSDLAPLKRALSDTLVMVIDKKSMARDRDSSAKVTTE